MPVLSISSHHTPHHHRPQSSPPSLLHTHSTPQSAFSLYFIAPTIISINHQIQYWGRSGGGARFLYRISLRTRIAKSKNLWGMYGYLYLSILIYAISWVHEWSNFPLSFACCTFCAPKQSGEWKVVLGSDDFPYLVSKVGAGSSTLWQKDWFLTRVPLAPIVKNEAFFAKNTKYLGFYWILVDFQ